MRKIYLLEIIVTCVSFPIFLIFGLITNLCISLLLFLLVPAFLTGIHGGIWLWDHLASAEVFKEGFPLLIKIICGVFLGLMTCFVVFGFSQIFIAPPHLIRQILELATFVLFFMCFYFLGYLIVIFIPSRGNESESSQKFEIDWKKSMIIMGIFSVVLLPSLLITFFTNILLSFEAVFTLISMFIVFSCEFGFTLAVLFWIHLRKTDMLKGEFLKTLKIFSVGSFIPLPFLLIGGIISLTLNLHTLIQIELLAIHVFIFWMFSYFIGLFYAVLKN